jgi:hypothetical protein
MVLRTTRSLLLRQEVLPNMDKMHNRDSNTFLHPLDNNHISHLLVQVILIFKRTAATLVARLINMPSSHRAIVHRQPQAIRTFLPLHLGPPPEDTALPIMQARGASSPTVVSRNSTVALLLCLMVHTLNMEELTERLQ